MCVPAIGGIVSAIGSIYSGMAQSAAYKAEAQAKKYEAQAQREQGSYESSRQIERNARITGQQVTAVASSGVDIWGTPSDVVADTRSEGEMDVQAIRHNSQFKSNLSEYEAKIAKMNAKQAKIGGIIGAAAPLINSFSGIGSSFQVA